MNKTVKAILIWVLILVAAVAVYSFLEHRPIDTSMLNLTESLNRVDAGQVAQVTIDGLRSGSAKRLLLPLLHFFKESCECLSGAQQI